MSELPPGFVLDQSAPATGLPPGFIIDNKDWSVNPKDIALGGGVGLAEGGMSLAGMPADAGSMVSSGVDVLGRKLGIEPDKVAAFKNAAVNMGMGNPLTAGVTNMMVNGPTGSQIKNFVQSFTGELPQPTTEYGKMAKTVGEFVPSVIGGPEAIGTKLLTRVVAPAAGSEIAGRLTEGTAAEPYARIAGGLAGTVGTVAAGRLAAPLPASAERQALAATLRNEGVDLTAGQTTGRKPLQWMESALGDTPGAGGVAGRMMENQAEQFTSAALRRAGIDARRATPEVIDNAFARIGNDFETVGRRNNVIADRRLGGDLNRVENEYNNVVSPSNRAPVIANTAADIGDMMAQNGGHLTGEQYNAIASRLARQARGARADPQLHEALQGLRSALDDAMERSLFRTGNSADMQILRNARNEYRNMMVLEKAATGAGSNAAEGLISPSQLRNAVVQQNRRAYGRGQGDFAELARAGEALLKPLPQSGTSPRHNAMHMLQTLGAVVGGGAGTAGGPAGALAGAAAGLAAPAVAGRALLSRPVQAWLSRQPGGNGQRNITREYLTNLMLSSGQLRSLPSQ